MHLNSFPAEHDPTVGGDTLGPCVAMVSGPLRVGERHQRVRVGTGSRYRGALGDQTSIVPDFIDSTSVSIRSPHAGSLSFLFPPSTLASDCTERAAAIESSDLPALPHHS